jgi:hypothetical protein
LVVTWTLWRAGEILMEVEKAHPASGWQAHRSITEPLGEQRGAVARRKRHRIPVRLAEIQTQTTAFIRGND